MLRKKQVQEEPVFPAEPEVVVEPEAKPTISSEAKEEKVLIEESTPKKDLPAEELTSKIETSFYPLMEPWTPAEPTPVGGIWLPVNKLSLLAPYIGLTTLLATAVITLGYVKKRKRKRD